MIRLSTILGLARSEARLARRLVRYWVFLSLATLAGAWIFLQFFFIHRFFSWASASAATANPRYFIGNYGAWFMMIFFIGLVFLGFDIRARDYRERIGEVVDALPITNLELVLGRALGLFLAAYVPFVAVMALMALVAWLVGAAIQPQSMITLFLLMAPPAYVFAIGLVFFVTLVVRHRLIAAVLSLVLLVLIFVVGIWWIPFYLTPLTDVSGGYIVAFPSDVIPSLSGLGGWFQRVGYLLAGLALLLFATAIHPRKDDSSRGLLAAAGGIILVVGVGLCYWQSLDWQNAVKAKEGWRAAHEARKDDAGPDIRSISGNLRIDPGRKLTMQLALIVAAPGEQTLDHALFTLNPDLEVGSISDASGGALQFTHEDGLLDVALASALAPGQELTLEMTIEGNPEPRFCYLDASIEALTITPVDGQIFVLGFDPIIFDRRYVALMPGVRWLPTSGAEVGRGNPEVHPADFYKLDLTVDLPEGWLVAGPGKRHEASAESGRVAFRFAPEGTLPEVALVAGRFESRSVDIEGVTLEMLVIPQHTTNLDYFEDSSTEIRDWLTEKLEEAANVGLNYPYDALTMVEIPNTLRGYGGGWRMDSTLIQPAMILMREAGFPTANFRSREDRFQAAKDEEGGVARAKRQTLERFFENDINGGNPFIATARSFFGYQTAGSGPEGVPLDYVWENLTSELVTERRGFFSVHFFDQDFGQEFVAAGQAMGDSNRVSDDYSDVLVHNIVSTNKVWDTVVDVSLLDLDPDEDPERTINVLSLKGGAMAQSMLDDLGREKTGQFLAALRENHQGGLYTRDDVVAAGDQVEADIAEWLALWIEQTDLPGFSVGDVSFQRLADGEDGAMQYQLLVTVRNGEDAPGLARLEYRIESDQQGFRWEQAEPFRVPGNGAVEVGLITSDPLRVARIAPYLSLNRDPFNIPLPALDEEKIGDGEPFSGTRESNWVPEETSAIVVDDLDDGFFWEEEEGRSMLRFSGRGVEEEDLDHGLPTPLQGLGGANQWSRLTYADAYGKYRRTMAAVRSGSGKRNAGFRAELTQAGEWELEYYFPGYAGRGSRRTSRSPGTWKLTIEDSSGTHEVEFDAERAEVGWNSLGRFEMATGEATVRISDDTEGDFVQADAIRWTPVTHGDPGAIAAVTRDNP
jgi:hypothetical protein